jgi:lysophospholipase L1-like esterase
VLALAAMTPATAGAAPCAGTHWVGAWAGPPSDASRGTGVSAVLDASGIPKVPVSNSTVRAVLTPTFGGGPLRVRLSNRFGTAPVTFTHATVGRATGTAARDITGITFQGGRRSVTVAPGHDVLTDPAAFRIRAFRSLAVSVFVAGDARMPTEHYLGRQYSFLTPPGTGDHAADADGAAFTIATTTRPFVTGLDVRAPRTAGAVVALGDSTTDGYQSSPSGTGPEDPRGLTRATRWPDVLARRLRAAGRELSVLNAGISGNRILRDAVTSFDAFGPSALHRLAADVIGQAGVTTVVWYEGINDVGQAPYDSARAVTRGLARGIRRLHGAGLTVVMATITPAGGHTSGQSPYDRVRRQVNRWIRTRSDADAVADFDAATRDPENPSTLIHRFDSGDHLHESDAGYRAVAKAVPLDALTDACP